MGCLHSKEEGSDLHPNVFRVVNIDEQGADLGAGQLEITGTSIVLYREGREATVWPLHSLRRYGFEGEIFSFESGRRCYTGEGIYAFKCQRAASLFRALQNQIQQRNIVHDTAAYPVSRISPSPQGRQTLQASVVHRSSIDNDQLDSLRPAINVNLIGGRTADERHANHNIRSNSSADILEVMPLYPRSQATNSHVSNVYQVRDFKRENNNNQDVPIDSISTEYSNDFNRDLAMLRNTLRQEGGLFQIKDEDETRFVESGYTNGHIGNPQTMSPLSPTLSTTSEHYAQLTLEQQEESARYYCNVNLTNKTLNKLKRIDTTPPTPVEKRPDGCTLSLAFKEVNMNTYANLSLGEPLNFNDHKFSESDTFTSMSPVEELEVNYAVLDIDANKCLKISVDLKRSQEGMSPTSLSYSSPKNASTDSCSTQRRSFLISQGSVDKTTASNESTPSLKNGYTTIDFDKTVALTSVAADAADGDGDGQRKTRHNFSNIICGSPTHKN